MYVRWRTCLLPWRRWNRNWRWWKPSCRQLSSHWPRRKVTWPPCVLRGGSTWRRSWKWSKTTKNIRFMTVIYDNTQSRCTRTNTSQLKRSSVRTRPILSFNNALVVWTISIQIEMRAWFSEQCSHKSQNAAVVLMFPRPSCGHRGFFYNDENTKTFISCFRNISVWTCWTGHLDMVYEDVMNL